MDLRNKILDHLKYFIFEEGDSSDIEFLKEEIESLSPNIIKALLNLDDSLKLHIFSDIDGEYILNQVKLIKILFPENRVSLTYPTSNSILVGGMDKEDIKNKTEVLFDKTLDKEKINQLLSPKAFTRIENFNESDHSNLVIKGNNLLGLHSILPRYKNKVDVIYIDPPYYFEETKGGDTFAYNSNFKLSSWLTFMKNRLEVSLDLLSDKGVILVSTNTEGSHYLKVLMDEVFKNGFIGEFSWRTRTGANDSDNNFSGDHEVILIFAKDKSKVKLKGIDKDFKNYKNLDNDPRGDWASDNLKNPHEDPKMYGVLIDPETQEEYPGYWRISKNNYNKYIADGRVLFPSYKKKLDPKSKSETPSLKRFKSELKSTSKPFSSISTDHLTQHGTATIKELFGNKVFGYPKPVELIKDLIRQVSDESSIVLDFFAGSATTAHAVIELNLEDKGDRKFILLEQMNYCRELTVERINKVLDKNKIKVGFTYVELMRDLSKEEILEAKTKEDLISVLKRLFDKKLLNDNLDLDNILDKISKIKSVDKLKKLVIEEYFDYTKEYTSYSPDLNLSAVDQEFNDKFYDQE